MTKFIPLLLLLAVAAAPCAAKPVQIGPDRYAMTVRPAVDDPESPRAARRTLRMIGDAAMIVCGVSKFSPLPVLRAMRRSACWRDSVADAVSRIDEPQLTIAWHDHP